MTSKLSLNFLNLSLWICLLQYASGYTWRRSQQCSADDHEPWSYKGGDNGPQSWGNRFPDCNGRSQSPIALSLRSAKPDGSIRDLKLTKYNVPVTRATAVNTGETVRWDIQDGVPRTMTANGVTFSLQQVHAHWGRKNHDGTEHVVDGKRNTMEVHFVHSADDGSFAVLSVLLEQYGGPNKNYQTLVGTLSAIPYKGDTARVVGRFVPRDLLPRDVGSFFRYQGSLTTPPCSEVVTWTVFKKRVPVAEKQMSRFRKLYSAPEAEAEDSCRISGNVRPLQNTNGRRVLFSG